MAKAAAAKSKELEGDADPDPNLEAPQGDAEGESLSESEPQARAQQPSGGNAASRIQELIGQNKQLVEERDVAIATRKTEEQELAAYRKERESQEIGDIIRNALQGEGRSEEDFPSDEGISSDAIAKIVAALQGAKPEAAAKDGDVGILMEERKVVKELSAVAPDLQLTAAQTGAVAELRRENSNLTVVEALTLAEMRQPSLFPDVDKRGFDPQIHGTTKPRGKSTSRKPPSSKQREAEHLTTAAKTTGEERMLHGLAALSQNPTVRGAYKHMHRGARR